MMSPVPVRYKPSHMETNEEYNISQDKYSESKDLVNLTLSQLSATEPKAKICAEAFTGIFQKKYSGQWQCECIYRTVAASILLPTCRSDRHNHDAAV